MIKVLNAGFYSCIQDFGRIGYQHYGVPVSGVMDKRAASVANALVGNEKRAAVMEITMSGPKLKFENNTTIAITGAIMNPSVNGKPITNNKCLSIKQGDVLSFGRLESGFRCYLAVSGGFQTQEVLGSRSMYKTITPFQSIEKQGVLKINFGIRVNEQRFSGLRVDDTYFESSDIEVLPGPEFTFLSEVQKEKLFTSKFTISKENNRMGYQLNETVANDLKQILTSPVIPGTVQLTPSGKLIILMRDCQTTGGYPRVLQLTDSGINTLAQKYTGKTINFRLKA
ncbi:biotin-dependent carboxyltransferase [Hyunsoonleella flava]|uniref:Biotin-dependent carboxyltransferase n=1 Tax=Hyunsoonleella flava TaxID=2527939 RepID=A0A4V2JAE6_9FLAO|nr:biotin-dependent carboxyltransferase family protein [Hyunsoonleella flava]TBN06366.1 biotin-dependent carboxyltransferase [Hyunsoonleella flava]